MPASHNLNTDATKPTWSLVVVLVLTLAAETAADFLKGWWNRDRTPPAAIDYASCRSYCDGEIATVSRDACTCFRPESR